MNELTMQEFTQKVVEMFGIDREYKGKDEDSINRLSNIDSFLTSIKEFEEQNENANFVDYLAGIMLISDQDDMENGGYVSLSTIHAVKGLEFKVVFVVALEEGLFPLTRAMNSNSEMEEERRLMYVAITRAEEKIYLTHVAKRYMYGKSNYEIESRFLKELGITTNKKPKIEKVKPSPRHKDDFFLEEEEPFDSGLNVGDIVEHRRFGKGKVVDISSDGLVGKIDFDLVGVKELMLNIATLEKLEDEND